MILPPEMCINFKGLLHLHGCKMQIVQVVLCGYGPFVRSQMWGQVKLAFLVQVVLKFALQLFCKEE